MNLLLVFIGGGIGSVCRMLTDKAVGAALGDKFPFGTLVVNVLGCFVIGLLIPAWSGQRSEPYAMRLLIVTGFLGGFTTFSAFGLQTFEKFRADRMELALLNIALNVVVGLAAVGAGAKIGRVFG